MKGGFTMIELALALVVLGILLLPLTGALSQHQSRKRIEQTKASLEQVKEALLNYAVHHRGCLPHAADFEGGLPDTGTTGIANYSDTGSVRQTVEPAGDGAGQRAGDVPWADLKLNGRGADADQHRIQYYVASPFTAPRQTRSANENFQSRDGCPARTRDGIEVWQPATPYQQGDIVAYNSGLFIALSDAATDKAPPGAPWQSFGPVKAWQEITTYDIGEYIAHKGKFYRALTRNMAVSPAATVMEWREIGLPDGAIPPAWQSHASEGYRRGELANYNGKTYRVTAGMSAPAIVPPASTSWKEITLPAIFLATRIGPIINTPPGNTVSSSQNVFILISPGLDRNNTTNREAVRDSNHMICTSSTLCSNWTSVNGSNVDQSTFSLSAMASQSPDSLLAVSYADYQAAIQKAGMQASGMIY